MASQFSDVPMAMWVNQNGCVFPVVACGDWVLPKDCFVMLWFWVMAGGKIYSKLWRHEVWNPVLWDLNPDHQTQIPHKFKENIFEWVFIKVYPRIQAWQPQFHYDQIERILQELAEDCPA